MEVREERQEYSLFILHLILERRSPMDLKLDVSATLSSQGVHKICLSLFPSPGVRDKCGHACFLCGSWQFEFKLSWLHNTFNH